MAELPPGRLEPMRAFVHPAIAVLVPFAFLCAIDGLVRGALLGSLVPPPAAGFRMLVLAAGAAEAVSANFLQRERMGGFGTRLREVVLVLAGTGGIAWLLSGRPFRGEFSPVAFEVLWPVFLAGVQWSLTLFVHVTLRERELFLSLVGGKEGAAIRQAARDASGEAGSAVAGLAKLRTMIAIFEAVVIAFLVIAYLGLNGRGGWWVPVAVAHEAVGVLAMSVLASFAHEQALLAAGIPADTRRLGAATATSAAGLGILFVAAIALAGSRPALPLSILAAVLEALTRLFSFTREPTAAPAVRAPSPGATDGGMRAMLESLNARETPAWIATTVRVLGIALAACAAAAALYFLLRPLLTRDTRMVLRSLHPVAALRRTFRRIAAIVAGLPRAFLAWLREGGGEAIRVLQAVAAAGAGPAVAVPPRVPSARRGAGARAPRSVREFVRIVRWGERRGVRFDRAEGPLEYAARLAAAEPARGADLAAAAAVFERIVYSGARSPTAERELAALVRAIMSRTR
jgi:hypothetical protein